MKRYKVLSLWQPWATLLVHGIKKIETRPKPTNWTCEKGTYLIHAAKRWTKEQTDICVGYPFADELLELGYEFYKGHALGLPLGCIIGSIEVKECLQITHITEHLDHFAININLIISRDEYNFGYYNQGRYAWICKNPKVLKTPIPYKGSQGYYADFKGDESKLIFQ